MTCKSPSSTVLLSRLKSSPTWSVVCRFRVISLSGRMDRLSVEVVLLVGSHLPFPSLVALSETSKWLRYCVDPLLERELAVAWKRHGSFLLDKHARKNNVPLTRKLLSPPYSVQNTSSGDEPALRHLLHASVCSGSVEMATMLIDDFGADPRGLERGDGNPNAIHLAAQAGQVAIAKLLLSRGIPITTTYTYRAGPNLGRARNNTMDAAARAGHPSFVEFLLKQNIEWPLDDSLVLALEEGHIGVLQTLLDAGASLEKIDDPSQELYYAFLRACNAGHTEAIRWVFDHGARFPPTTTNPYGFVNGPLLSALRANRPNPDVMSTLIEHGGGSPLVISNTQEIVNELVKVAQEARRDLSSFNNSSDSESEDWARRIRRIRNRARGHRARNEPELWKGNPTGARRFHALCDHIVPLLLENGLDADLLASELQQPDIPDSIAREMTKSA
uniref:Ankyrin n=1 Tax=Mycena chlorophos TaxID=658473 RepID=A0ABQ0L2G7_MYCCL|nr:predicted protein [Mycena chlorophos]